MIATGNRLKDRYRLERLLGRGGMASVWLGTDEVLERPVAVKVLSDTISSDPEFRARFRREAHVVASLSHPNLIGVYDYADGEERPYLVMEYVPGPTLSQRTSEGAAIDCGRLARELLGALAHIHAAGILHRDVKPQNVLIGPDGTAKLIDFGIALPRDATALTRTGNLLGTARYIAPEVMTGKPASERSDLYSCGIVLGDCAGAGSSASLRDVIHRLSDPDPARRPASAREALARLGRERVAVEEPTEVFAVPPPAPEAAREDQARSVPVAAGRGSRAWARAGAVAAMVAAAGLAGTLLVFGDGGQEPAGNGGQGERSAARAEKRTATTGQATTTERPAAGSAAPGAAAEPEAAPVPTAAGEDAELGAALNLEGFELIQAGDPAAAVPVLEEAVRAFPAGSEDLDYAYALFNLGNALRLSGRPEEAIPVLERRLEIPNQTDAVLAELEAARAEAG